MRTHIITANIVVSAVRSDSHDFDLADENSHVPIRQLDSFIL
jgi:hypothetical protein